MSKSKFVDALREALQAELKAVKMYDAHAGAVADPDIALGLRTILEVEKGHVRALAERITELGGQPGAHETVDALASADPTSTSAVVADMLRADLGDEQWAIKHYAATIADFFVDGDDETLAVLEDHLMDEMRHARWLRDRLRLLALSE